jgi:WD40 repeat protein
MLASLEGALEGALEGVYSDGSDLPLQGDSEVLKMAALAGMEGVVPTKDEGGWNSSTFDPTFPPPPPNNIQTCTPDPNTGITERWGTYCMRKYGSCCRACVEGKSIPEIPTTSSPTSVNNLQQDVGGHPLLCNLLSTLSRDEPKVIVGPNSTVFSLSYEPNTGYLAAGCEDGTVKVFEARDNFRLTYTRTCFVSEGAKIRGGGGYEVLRVAWGKDGEDDGGRRLYAGTASGLVEVIKCGGGGGEEGGRDFEVIGVLDSTIDEEGNVTDPKDEVAPQVYGLVEVGYGRVAVGTDDQVTVWNANTGGRIMGLNFRRIGGKKAGGGRNPNGLVYVFGMDWSSEREELCVSLSDGTIRVVGMDGTVRSVVCLPGVEAGGTGVRWEGGGEAIVSTFTTGHVVKWR